MFKVMGLILFLGARSILNLILRAELVVVETVVQVFDDFIITIITKIFKVISFNLTQKTKTQLPNQF